MMATRWRVIEAPPQEEPQPPAPAPVVPAPIAPADDVDWVPVGSIKGPKGDKGDTGAPNPGIEFAFPVASTQWVCQHNLGTQKVTVDTADTYAREIHGDVEFVDENTVIITWTYPTTGAARVSL